MRTYPHSIRTSTAAPDSGRRQALAALAAMATGQIWSSGTASAAPKETGLLVSTGVAKGTYAEMFGQLAEVCGPAVGQPLVGVATSGSLETLDNLLKNRSHVGLVQADVLHARQLVEDLQRLRAVLVLNREEVHLLASLNGPERGGFMGLGRSRLELSSLADLAGRRVAAFGGGVTTARLIQLQGELAFKIHEFAGPQEAMVALKRDAVDAVLAVGGAPLSWITALPPGQFKLLTVAPALAERLKNVYRKASISYPQLASDPVPTIATEALLVAQDYSGGANRQALLQLRQCLVTQIDTLRSTVGYHPKWQQVNPQATASWPMYAPTQEAPVAGRKASLPSAAGGRRLAGS